MKKYCVIVLIFLFVVMCGATEKANSLQGTWCTTENSLILTFSGKDSVSVSSLSDSTTKGAGTYQKNDSTFSATILNKDVTIKMHYRYHWKGKDAIEAQAVLFTVNGDTVESPKEWAIMKRCANPSAAQKNAQDAKKGTVPKKTSK